MNSIILQKIALGLPCLAVITALFSSVSANAQNVSIPVPGSAGTSSTDLYPEYKQPHFNASTPNLAQSEPTPKSNVKVGRSTRGGSSYLGLGANIGIDGGTSSLADGNFSIISKIGLTKNFSFRPGAVLGDNATILLPITLDFPLDSLGDQFREPQGIAPYIGVGAAIKTGDNSDTAVLVTGGIDVPLNQQFTANVAVNAGFFSQTDVGVILGVGYNFTGF